MNILNNEELLFEIVPESLRNDVLNNKELIEANLKYLKELGVKDIDNIFKTYYPMFLMDVSNFKRVFSKYDPQDLIEKINKNITIIEHL